MLVVKFTETFLALPIRFAFRFGSTEVQTIGGGLFGLLLAFAALPETLQVSNVTHNCPDTLCRKVRAEFGNVSMRCGITAFFCRGPITYFIGRDLCVCAMRRY